MYSKSQPLFRIAPLTLAIASAFTSVGTVYASNLSDLFDKDGKAEIDLSQNSHRENLDWDTFNIQAGQELTFIQKGAESVVVNNINDTSASTIFGTINANGHVYLVNTNGFVFNSNTNINTAGFLASTFATSLSENSLNLSGDSSGSINLNGFNTGSSTQYVAFYSSSITLGNDTGDANLNLGDGNAYFHTGEGMLTDTVEIVGLPSGFAIDRGSLSNTLESFDINEGTNVNLSGENSKIIINQNNLNDILDSAVNLPEVINSQTLELYSKNNAEITRRMDFGLSDIKQFKLASTGEVTISNTILGTGLDLTLESKQQVTINDGAVGNEFGYLGGSPGLNNIRFETPILQLSRSVNGESIYLDGNLIIDRPSTRLLLNGRSWIKINSEILLNESVDLDLFSENITLSGVGGEGLSNPNDITIYADDLKLSGDFFFNNRLQTTTSSASSLNLHINNDIGFYGKEIFLDSTNFLDQSGDLGFNINFGSETQFFDIISLQNISHDESTVHSLDFFLSDSEFGLQIGGNLSVRHFFVTKETGTFNPNILLNTDLYLSDLENLDLSNIRVDSTTSGLFASSSNNENSIASLNNVSAYGLRLTGFKTIDLYGSDIGSNTNDLTLDSETINTLDENLTLTSTSGDVSILGQVNANGAALEINTNSGSVSLSGMNDAKSISIQQARISSASTHILEGNYTATDFINMSDLDQIESINGFSLESNQVNLIGSSIISTGNIAIVSNDSQLDTIEANAIQINGNNIGSGTTELYGNLLSTSQSDDFIDFYVDEIILKNDISMTGNINLFDRKKHIKEEDRFWLIDAEDTETFKVANLYGPEDITFNLSNDEAYFYNIGEQDPLSSITVNGVNDQHTGNIDLSDKPIIAGALGLTVHGDWYWNSEAAITYQTQNYNLDLSGVTINAVDKVTFNTGAGDLALGDIGTNGTVKDLVIDEANTLSLYGDLQLTEPENGYQFSNINAIRLYKDLTLGSKESAIAVNFGNATIDGTHSLTIFSNDLTLGQVGSNIALQNISLWSEETLNFSHDINVVGSIDIQANSLSLDSIINTTGLDISINTVSDLNMGKLSSVTAENGNIQLSSETGNIELGSLSAGQSVLINTEIGGIYNAIDDYISDDSTSTNITTSDLTLIGKLRIGESVASPIVIDYRGNEAINSESDGNIYIANLNDSPTNSNSRIFDSSSSNDIAIIDAYNQLQLSSLNAYIEPQYETTLGLIDHFSWQTVGEEKVKKIQRPSSTPNLYYGRDGWRLGYFGK